MKCRIIYPSDFPLLTNQELLDVYDFQNEAVEGGVVIIPTPLSIELVEDTNPKVDIQINNIDEENAYGTSWHPDWTITDFGKPKPNHVTLSLSGGMIEAVGTEV